MTVTVFFMPRRGVRVGVGLGVGRAVGFGVGLGVGFGVGFGVGVERQAWPRSRPRNPNVFVAGGEHIRVAPIR